MSSFPFDHVVISFPDERAASAARKGPLGRLEELYHPCQLHAVTDPFNARVGSGGGTLAALELTHKADRVLILHAGGESSRCPTQMVLGKAWTSLPCNQQLETPISLWLELCRRLFCDIPAGSVVVVASDTLLQLKSIQLPQWSECQQGAVVGLAVPAALETAKNHGVYEVLSLPFDNDNDATDIHPVRPCRAVYQKPTISTLEQHCSFEHNGELKAWIDTGVVIFLPRAASAFRSLSKGALKACTVSGLSEMYTSRQQCASDHVDDSITLKEYAQTNALKVDLYTHILQVLSLEEQPVTMEAYCKSHGGDKLSQNTLQAIYSTLQGHPLQIWTVASGQFLHLGTTRELVDFLVCPKSAVLANDDYNKTPPRQILCQEFASQLHLVQRLRALPLYTQEVDESTVLLHSYVENGTIGAGSVLEHCWLEGTVEIGVECLVSGLRNNRNTRIPNGTIVQMLPLSENGFVYLALGLDDDIKKKGTLFGRTWEDFFSWSGLSKSDLWSLPHEREMIWTAKLHPIVNSDIAFDSVFDWLFDFRHSNPASNCTSFKAWNACQRLSLSEIRDKAHAGVEFAYREGLLASLDSRVEEHCQDIQTALTRRQHRPIHFQYAVEEYASNGRTKELYSTVKSLFTVVEESEKRSPDVCGRACMILSGLFRELSQNVTNPLAIDALWRSEHGCSFQDAISVAFPKLTNASDNQKMDAYEVMFEKAGQLMTNRCVSSWTKTMADLSTRSSRSAIMDQWVIATSPARVDLAGGWSDTPPICFEYGSKVIGMAVLLDGKMPLSCRCRLVEGGCGATLVTEQRDIKTGKAISSNRAVLRSAADLGDFHDPKAHCALLKCALICLGLCSAEDAAREDPNEIAFQKAIQDFAAIEEETTVGLEVVATSLLPQGSGLGTSSILGGCVLSAISRCVGIDFGANSSERVSTEMLVEGVLILEQELTTGGGFQDQVNGLIGGVKIVENEPCSSPPFSLRIDHLAVDQKFRTCLNSRVFLAFTGKTRLAKNILQNVLIRWSKRTAEIVHTVKCLVEGAEQAKKAVVECNFEALADCVNDYWELKKIMAGSDSGVEPPNILETFVLLKKNKLIHGASLCGAGGGGFLVVLACEGVKKQDLEEATRGKEVEFLWHDCQLSENGVSIDLLPMNSARMLADFEMNWHARSTQENR